MRRASNALVDQLLAAVLLVGCGKPHHGSCVEGEAQVIRVILEKQEVPDFAGVSITDDPAGRKVLTLDPLVEMEGPHRPLWNKEAEGPLRWLVCDHGLVVHYPRRGTGEQEAPRRDAKTLFVPLSKIVSVDIDVGSQP